MKKIFLNRNLRSRLHISFSSKGDVVLLSPSCSSTDMFSDYKDRGNKFRELSGFS